MHSRCVVPFEEFCPAGCSHGAIHRHTSSLDEHSHYGSWRPGQRPVQDESLVRDVGCLNYNSLREISAATADLWRVHEALGKQRAVLGTGYGATSKPVVIHDYQNVQYYGSLVVDTPSDEMNVLYVIGSSNLWVPNSRLCHRRCKAPLLSTQNVEFVQESRQYIDCDIAGAQHHCCQRRALNLFTVTSQVQSTTVVNVKR